jgi:diguanylate cyclase (GGDEF)-like protein
MRDDPYHYKAAIMMTTDIDTPRTILLVSADVADTEALRRILEEDYTIFAATSGRDVLRQVKEKRPDLIMIDAVLPDGDGYDALVGLKGDEAACAAPVIIITAPDSGNKGEARLLRGAADYIDRPFQNAVVRARVHTHMQIVRHMRAIGRLSREDLLTGLPNRLAFEERMAGEWRQSMRMETPLALALIHVDSFSVYNETYGLPQGDTLLKIVAELCAGEASGRAGTIARLRREIFALILPDTELEPAAKLAEELRGRVEVIRVPTIDPTIVTRATVSVGVASCLARADRTIAGFLAKAEANLHAARTAGRNKTVAA